MRVRSAPWVAALLGLGMLITAPTTASAEGYDWDINFRTVDQSGKLVTGGNYNGWSCSRLAGEPEWTCTDLNEYSWFRNLTPRGTTNNYYSSEIDLEPEGFCIVLEETAAPTGLEARPDYVLACNGANGWTPGYAPPGTAITIGQRTFKPQYGDWKIANDAAAKTTVFSLVHSKPAPAGPTDLTVIFSKTDAKGKLLSGGTYEGRSCTRWDNDLNWQCQDLNEYPWLNGKTKSLSSDGTTNRFGIDVPIRSPWTSSPSDHCIFIREVKAPKGYQVKSAWSVLCGGPEGWLPKYVPADLLKEYGVARASGPWTVTNVKATLTTTIRLVNLPVSQPTKPAKPRRGIGARTGIDESVAAQLR